LDGNSLRVREGAETLAVLARVALHDCYLRQLLAIGLADIEHVGSPETCDRSRFFVFLVVLRVPANDGSENQDAFLALLYETAKLFPGAKAGDVAGIRLLRSDQQHVVQAVAVKASDGFEITGQRFAAARVERSD
jgi:hypothetical protein